VGASGVLVGVSPACNATPVPEPPELSPENSVNAPNPDSLSLGGQAALDANKFGPSGVALTGEPGSVPGGAVVRATYLNGKEPPSTTVAAANGSFSIAVAVEANPVIRLQVEVGELRSQPVDVTVSEDGSLRAVTRFECLTVSASGGARDAASLELDLGSAPVGEELTGELVIRNECEGPVTLSLPALRVNEPAFAVDPLPTSVAVGERERFAVSFAPANLGRAENILLFSVSLGDRRERYAVTLTAVGTE
jgi:hypothetical protein